MTTEAIFGVHSKEDPPVGRGRRDELRHVGFGRETGTVHVEHTLGREQVLAALFRTKILVVNVTKHDEILTTNRDVVNEFRKSEVVVGEDRVQCGLEVGEEAGVLGLFIVRDVVVA